MIEKLQTTFSQFNLKSNSGIDKAFAYLGNYVFTSTTDVLVFMQATKEAAYALNYKHGILEGLYYMALLGFLKGDSEIYKSNFKELENNVSNKEGDIAQAWFFMLQAAIARENGKVDDTRELYRITYELAQMCGLAYLEARARFNYATTFDVASGRTPRLEALKKIELKNLENDYPGLASHIYMQTAQSFAGVGMYNQALSYIEPAIKLARYDLAPHALAQCLMEKALILMNTHQYDEAIRFFNETYEVSEKNDLLAKVPACVNLTEIYRLIGNRDKAWDMLYHTESLINDSPEFIYPKMVLESIKGNLLVTDCKYEEARNAVESTIPFLSGNHRLAELAAAYETLGNILKIEKNFESAIEVFEKLRQLDKEIAEERNAEQIANIEITNRMQEAETERKRSLELRLEKERSETLLLNILPAEVAEELKLSGGAKAKRFNNVTVLFSDFKSFTTVSEKLSPEELVNELHECFSGFDRIMERHGIEKIKTIGDAYLAVSGLPIADSNHSTKMIMAALDIREFMKQRKILVSNTFDVRIGVHSGSVVAGIVGVKKFAYDIWGDTVNTAARMEQSGEVGKINISEATYELVKDKIKCDFRGEIEAKNKGRLKMYFVVG